MLSKQDQLWVGQLVQSENMAFVISDVKESQDKGKHDSF